jgi:hypothetical protein
MHHMQYQDLRCVAFICLLPEDIKSYRQDSSTLIYEDTYISVVDTYISILWIHIFDIKKCRCMYPHIYISIL